MSSTPLDFADEFITKCGEIFCLFFLQKIKGKKL